MLLSIVEWSNIWFSSPTIVLKLLIRCELGISIYKSLFNKYWYLNYFNSGNFLKRDSQETTNNWNSSENNICLSEDK